MLHKIDSLIDTLTEIRISNSTTINELEEIKRDLTAHTKQANSTEAKLREATNASHSNIQRNQHSSPNTTNRNTGTAPPKEDVDSKGNTIEVGDTVQVLSTGLFKGTRGVVMKLGKAKVSLRLDSGRSTNRKSTNLEVVTIDV